MIKIAELGHLLIKVASIRNSLSFYRDLLGFELVEYDEENHGKTAFLSLGRSGHAVDLLEVGSDLGEIRESRLHHFALRVETESDLTHAYFELLDAGVKIIRATDHDSQKSVFVYDPDGNIVELYYELPNALEKFREGRVDTDKPIEFVRP